MIFENLNLSVNEGVLHYGKCSFKRLNKLWGNSYTKIYTSNHAIAQFCNEE